MNEAVEQVAYADRIIINKTDLVGGRDGEIRGNGEVGAWGVR